MLHLSQCYWRVKWDNTRKPLSPVAKRLSLPLTHPAVIHMVAIQTTIRSSLYQAMHTVALGDRKSLSYSSHWTRKAAAAEWQERKMFIPVHHPPWQMERLRANVSHTCAKPVQSPGSNDLKQVHFHDNPLLPWHMETLKMLRQNTHWPLSSQLSRGALKESLWKFRHDWALWRQADGHKRQRQKFLLCLHHWANMLAK